MLCEKENVSETLGPVINDKQFPPQMPYNSWNVAFVLLVVGTAASALLSSFGASDTDLSFGANVSVITFSGLVMCLLIAYQVYELKRFHLWSTVIVLFFASFPILAGLELSHYENSVDETVLIVLALLALFVPFPGSNTCGTAVMDKAQEPFAAVVED